MKKINIKEATTTGGGRGSYIAPLQPGFIEFDEDVLGPFTDPASNYIDADLAYDSYDGNMDISKKKIKGIEKKAKKISDYNKKHPVLNDDDGDNINPYPGKMNEWIEITDDLIVEDLGVWFGTKKKPKGSSQPKGPWVNICRKVDGKHPPCGRDEAKDRGYPKCRAAGVAGKMTDTEKRNACSQKRRVEKGHDKSGTGNKPKMTSYKKKSLKESDIDILVERILRLLL